MAKQDNYVRYTIRVPEELYSRIKESAGDKSINAEIIERIELSFSADKATDDVNNQLLELRKVVNYMFNFIENMEDRHKKQNNLIVALATALASNRENISRDHFSKIENALKDMENKDDKFNKNT